MNNMTIGDKYAKAIQALRWYADRDHSSQVATDTLVMLGEMKDPEVSDEDMDKIEAVLHWAEEKPHFDTSFIDSLQVACAKYGHLTENQRNALDNIIEKWCIEV